MQTLLLDGDAIAAVDSTSQVQETLGLADHLRDALWRVDSAGLPRTDAPGGLVVAGMGGSAIGARLAFGALGNRARRPLALAQGYAVPSWIGAGSCVLVSSYSGDTEESLACYDDARERGAALVVATTGGALAARARRDGVPVVPLPGGFQPRAAVGYATVTALEVAAACGAAPSLRDEVEGAAALTGRLAGAWGPEAEGASTAKALAIRLADAVPVVAGAELMAPVAYRWKCQFNENAELPSFSGELPEVDHNEICGWEAAGELGRFVLVLLDSPLVHPANARRAEATARIVRDAGVPVERVAAVGETRLEQVLAAVLLGDLVSLYTAVLRGVDPIGIAAIDALKRAIAEG